MTSRWLRLQRKKQQVWHCGEKETWFKGQWLINQNRRPHGLEIIGSFLQDRRVHLKIHRTVFLSPAPEQSAKWERIPQYCVAKTAFSTIYIRSNYFKLEGREWKSHSALFTVRLRLWNVSIVLFCQPMLKLHSIFLFCKTEPQSDLWVTSFPLQQLMTVFNGTFWGGGGVFSHNYI